MGAKLDFKEKLMLSDSDYFNVWYVYVGNGLGTALRCHFSDVERSIWGY